MSQNIIDNCRILLQAYKEGKLGNVTMPEDTNPGFSENESRLSYFTLPMSLNYQRNSYKLWEAALETYNDSETKIVFSVNKVAKMDPDTLRRFLLKYKLALQPNKHIATWQKICSTIANEWGSVNNLINTADQDFLKLRNLIQVEHKKGFPYLSGPKIFNYWSFILREYCNVPLKNSAHIEIAPDTHVIKCSIKLGVINDPNLSKEAISNKWRTLLQETDINPIDMHSPLWFWSRNNFQFQLP